MKISFGGIQLSKRDSLIRILRLNLEVVRDKFVIGISEGGLIWCPCLSIKVYSGMTFFYASWLGFRFFVRNGEVELVSTW